jgi:Fe2+ transport system protein FeoA
MKNQDESNGQKVKVQAVTIKQDKMWKRLTSTGFHLPPRY